MAQRLSRENKRAPVADAASHAAKKVRRGGDNDADVAVHAEAHQRVEVAQERQRGEEPAVPPERDTVTAAAAAAAAETTEETKRVSEEVAATACWHTALLCEPQTEDTAVKSPGEHAAGKGTACTRRSRKQRLWNGDKRSCAKPLVAVRVLVEEYQRVSTAFIAELQQLRVDCEAALQRML
jgi:hypothetical protein